MLILASNSPRRKQLLALGGWDFYVLSPDIDENLLADEKPPEYVLRVAREKARCVANLLENTPESPHVILAADTAVVIPGLDEHRPARILGKPSTPDEALEMLCLLRGQTHQVYTGLVTLRLPDQQMQSEVVSTEVEMRNYSDPEILAYIASGDPMDKAGAYAIQSQFFQPVQNLQGCYANVMGLPLCHVARLLSGLGFTSASNIYQRCQQNLDIRCEVYAQIL